MTSVEVIALPLLSFCLLPLAVWQIRPMPNIDLLTLSFSVSILYLTQHLVHTYVTNM